MLLDEKLLINSLTSVCSLIARSLLNATRELSWKVCHPAASFSLLLLLNVSILVAPGPEALPFHRPCLEGIRLSAPGIQRDKDVPRPNVLSGNVRQLSGTLKQWRPLDLWIFALIHAFFLECHAFSAQQKRENRTSTN